MQTHTRVVEQVEWTAVHAATLQMDETGNLVLSDGRALDWHLLRMADPRLKGARVKLTLVARPTGSCDTNLFLVRLGGSTICSIRKDGKIDIDEHAEEIVVEHQPDGFLRIVIVFESHHASVSLGTGKPEGWYVGSGQAQYIFRVIEVELLAGSRIREMVMKRLWQGADPFEDPQHNLYDRDLQGWNSQHRLLSETITEIRPPIIVEIGVWKGASTVFMAEEVKKIKSDSAIISVDTFLGSSEHWLGSLTPDFRSRNGYPFLYQKFLSNITNSDVENYVVPLPMDSLNAVQIITSLDLFPHMIHLDGGHDYQSVMSDLQAWWPALAPGGVLVGDDYYENGTWPMVKRAFDEFFGERGAPIEHDAGKCRIRKP